MSYVTSTARQSPPNRPRRSSPSTGPSHPRYGRGAAAPRRQRRGRPLKKSHWTSQAKQAAVTEATSPTRRSSNTAPEQVKEPAPQDVGRQDHRPDAGELKDADGLCSIQAARAERDGDCLLYTSPS